MLRREQILRVMDDAGPLGRRFLKLASHEQGGQGKVYAKLPLARLDGVCRSFLLRGALTHPWHRLCYGCGLLLWPGDGGPSGLLGEHRDACQISCAAGALRIQG